MKNVLFLFSWKEFFRELLLLVFTLVVFFNLYFERLDISFLFALLIVALQIEKVGDKLGK